MDEYNLNNHDAFAYKKDHSTETMMLGISNDILGGFDENKCTVMMFLDLSAAFDTIDINKLLVILSEEIGLTGAALGWCESFLRNRTQRVKVNGEYSESCPVKYGAPQGSVLGPKFFNIYVRSQPRVFRECGFRTTAFADDSNGMKTFAITFQYNILTNDVPNCIEKVTNWMNVQFLKINPDKTEIILFHPKSLKRYVVIGGTMVAGECIRFSKVVKNVGVWLDSEMNMDTHVNKRVSHCYKLLRDIGRIRSILSREHVEMLVHAVIASRLDYCNSILCNMNKSNLYKLQKVQNTAARLVLRRGKRQSATGMLRELHWLKVESRILSKLLLLIYKCVHGRCSRNLQVRYKMHNCRPEDYLMLATKRVNTKYGKRTFDYLAPKLWNALPLHVRTEENIDIFKKQVKTLLFDGCEDFKKRAFKYD